MLGPVHNNGFKDEPNDVAVPRKSAAERLDDVIKSLPVVMLRFVCYNCGKARILPSNNNTWRKCPTCKSRRIW